MTNKLDIQLSQLISTFPELLQLINMLNVQITYKRLNEFGISDLITNEYESGIKAKLGSLYELIRTSYELYNIIKRELPGIPDDLQQRLNKYNVSDLITLMIFPTIARCYMHKEISELSVILDQIKLHLTEPNVAFCDFINKLNKYGKNQQDIITKS